MSRITLVVSTLMLAVCPFASANPPSLQAVQRSWNQNIQQVTAFGQVSFVDENGDWKALFYKTAEFPNGGGLFGIGANGAHCPVNLFVLDAKPSRMTLDQGTIPEFSASPYGAMRTFHGGETITDTVARYADNKLSAYFINQVNGDQVIVSRHDRPSVQLPGHVEPNWYEKDRTFAGQGTPGDKMIVLAPNGVAPASATPMTARQDKNCRNLKSYIDQEKGRLSVKAFLLPQEIEFMLAPLSDSTKLESVAPAMDAAQDQIGQDITPALNFLKSYRNSVRAGVAALKAAQRPDEMFLPVESKLLACRLADVGGNAEGQFYGQIKKINGDPAETKAFVSWWRSFLDDDLQMYLTSAPHLTQEAESTKTPDLSYYENELIKRTEDALQGQGSAPPTSVGAASHAAPQGRTVALAPKARPRPRPHVPAVNLNDILNQ